MGSADPRSPQPVSALFDRIRKDATVTRREYLRILVTVSGGLLAGTVAIALGVFKRADHVPGGGSPAPLRIATAIAPGASVRFDYPGPGSEAMAIRMLDGTLVAYSSECTHLSCAVLWEDRKLACPCHDGQFDPGTGEVVAGPPPRPLPKVLLEEREDGIYAVGVELR